jgi:hypothetical protein
VLDHQAQRLTRSEELHRALVQVVLGGGDLPEVAAALADPSKLGPSPIFIRYENSEIVQYPSLPALVGAAGP